MTYAWTLDPAMSGPCFICRREMNWMAATPDAWRLCRWCLQYVIEALRWAPAYGRLLVLSSYLHARARHDPDNPQGVFDWRRVMPGGQP